MAVPSSPTCGECGSPSSSACAWCLRWSATQSMTGPWTDIEPAIAKPHSIGFGVWGGGGGGEWAHRAVEADGHAEAGDEVHDGERHEVTHADVAVPQQHDRGE